MEPDPNGIELLIKTVYPLYGAWEDMAKEIGYARAAWAQKQLYDAMHDPDVEYPDNGRYCRVGNAVEEAEFKESSDMGCCGSSEWEATDSEGQVWRFGFNYGH